MLALLKGLSSRQANVPPSTNNTVRRSSLYSSCVVYYRPNTGHGGLTSLSNSVSVSVTSKMYGAALVGLTRPVSVIKMALNVSTMK